MSTDRQPIRGRRCLGVRAALAAALAALVTVLIANAAPSSVQAAPQAAETTPSVTAFQPPGEIGANADTVGRDSAASAAAQADAYNERELWLKFPADAGAEACKSREIYLAAGRYWWSQGHTKSFSLEGKYRRIDLAAGWYVWKDCIQAPTYGGTYYHDTYLRQKSTGGYARLNDGRLGTTDTGTYQVTFGSALWRL